MTMLSLCYRPVAAIEPGGLGEDGANAGSPEPLAPENVANDSGDAAPEPELLLLPAPRGRPADDHAQAQQDLLPSPADGALLPQLVDGDEAPPSSKQPPAEEDHSPEEIASPEEIKPEKKLPEPEKPKRYDAWGFELAAVDYEDTPSDEEGPWAKEEEEEPEEEELPTPENVSTLDELEDVAEGANLEDPEEELARLSKITLPSAMQELLDDLSEHNFEQSAGELTENIKNPAHLDALVAEFFKRASEDFLFGVGEFYPLPILCLPHHTTRGQNLHPGRESIGGVSSVGFCYVGYN